MILAGIISGNYLWWIDSINGIIVSLVIFYTTYHILKYAISILIGEEPNEDLTDKIKEILNANCKYDLQLHHLHLYMYGSTKELTFHICLPGVCIYRKLIKLPLFWKKKFKKKWILTQQFILNHLNMKWEKR